MAEAGVARQVSMTQGQMTIEGLPEPFVQGLGRHLRLTAGELQIARGFASRDGRLTEASRILGRARLVGDSLRRAGFEDEAGEIALTISPLGSGEDGRILLVIDFQESEGDTDGFRAELLTPAAAFEALKQDVVSGAAQTLSVSATTSLWVPESQRDASPALPVSWHLGLEQDGHRNMPARGLVERMGWHFAAPAPAAAPEAAGDEDVRELAADQLGRIDWSLKQIALVLMFLLIVIALK